MTRAVSMLLVEDNPPDVLLVQRSFARAGVQNSLTVATSGEQAMECLRGLVLAGEPPDLVLLDLKLPGMSGEDVLAKLREEPSLAGVRVVVLTSSTEEEAIVRSYALQADAFVVKPLDAEQLFAVVRQLDGFGVTFVRAR